MQADDVRQLEHLIEAALDTALAGRTPKPVSPRTRHLMAKAAVAVLEAVDAEDERGRKRG
jgi:hypothetical protein